MSQDACNLNIKQGGERENHLGGNSRWRELFEMAAKSIMFMECPKVPGVPEPKDIMVKGLW